MIIKDLKAREVLDSRGYPTIEAEVIVDEHIVGIGIVPSGASKGSKEALELRDDDNRFHGKGVTKAIKKVQTEIKEALIGKDIASQEEIDNFLIALDGTDNKSRLGANSILAVSLAISHAFAKVNKQELYEYLNESYANDGKLSMPVPLINIVNGGAHADNNLDVQEFMIIPWNAPSFREAIRQSSEIFHALRTNLKKAHYSISVGDEGGFAPNLRSNAAVIEEILSSIEVVGLKAGEDVAIGLDVASTEFYHDGKYILKSEKKEFDSLQLIDYYVDLVKQYPIVSIEDGLAEDDWEGWKILTDKLGNKIQIIGDDLFVTNEKLLNTGIEKGIANAILVKPNQIGTLTETFNTLKRAQKAKYATIISHRSGETEDTTIADLAVATDAKQIKSGSLSRSERIAKYNRLLRIEEALGSKVKYSGKDAINSEK